RRGSQQFPGLWNPVGRVLRQETVQQRRAAARQTRDDNGAADLLRRNLRTPPPVLLEPEAIGQMADDGLSRRDPPQEIQARFGSECAQQAVESLEKCSVFELAASCSPPAGGEQVIGVERHEPPPRTFQQSRATPDDLADDHLRSPKHPCAPGPMRPLYVYQWRRGTAVREEMEGLPLT